MEPQVEHTRPRLQGQIALVVGVGPGLGAALGRRFAEAKMRVAIVARHEHTLEEVRRAKMPETAEVLPIEADATREDDVTALFANVRDRWGDPDLVVYNAGGYDHHSILETDPQQFMRCWKIGCFGAFLVGRAAAAIMVGRGSGTIIFTGATESLRAAGGFASLAVEKFGLRALAQSMARELGPRGVHVAHAIVDGRIVSERFAQEAREQPPAALLAPGAIAESYLHLHEQHRSAWTHELDLRPWLESC